MSNPIEKFQIDMQLRNLSLNTQDSYLGYVRRFEAFFGKPLEDMGAEEVRLYLHDAIMRRDLSSSTLNCIYSALRFFYETTLEREWNLKKLPRARKEKHQPVVLSQTEVAQLLNAASNLKHKAILATTYSAGLRVSEVARLRLADIDSTNMQIHIRLAKGQKDRDSLLSRAGLQLLRRYWVQYHPADWLFPGRIPGKTLSPSTIQHIFHKAKAKAGIKKRATIHSLRHSFATHLLEAGVNLFYLQKLMGHANIRTTIRYLHLTRAGLNITSPLDSLEGFRHD